MNSGRSPQGECGLKYALEGVEPVVVGRSLQGECGLKYESAQGLTVLIGHSPQGECGLKFLDRLVKRSVPGSLSLRRAWIEIGVCSVPATAWMSLSLFMSSVLRTCGDDSACAGLLVSMTIRGVKASLWARVRGLRYAGLLRSACHNPSQARRS